MFEQIKSILAKQLRIDESEIKLDSKIQADLGADSLDILQILMTIEDEQGIVIPDEELMKFETVKDILTYMEQNQK